MSFFRTVDNHPVPINLNHWFAGLGIAGALSFVLPGPVALTMGLATTFLLAASSNDRGTDPSIQFAEESEAANAKNNPITQAQINKAIKELPALLNRIEVRGAIGQDSDLRNRLANRITEMLFNSSRRQEALALFQNRDACYWKRFVYAIS